MTATLLKPRSEIVPVYREDVAKKHGKVRSGYQVKHWDGRIDAHVGAPPALLIVNQEGITAEEIQDLGQKQLEALLTGVRGGAFQTVSGWYTANMLDVFDATQSAFDYLTNAHKIMMFTNSIAAMSYYTDTASNAAPYNANEVSGTGYTAGGYTLANKTLTQSPNGTVMFDNTIDPNWSITGSFATAARGAVVYSTTTPANWLVLAIAFGADYNVTNGTFTIQLNSLGMGTILFAA